MRRHSGSVRGNAGSTEFVVAIRRRTRPSQRVRQANHTSPEIRHPQLSKWAMLIYPTERFHHSGCFPPQIHSRNLSSAGPLPVNAGKCGAIPRSVEPTWMVESVLDKKTLMLPRTQRSQLSGRWFFLWKPAVPLSFKNTFGFALTHGFSSLPECEARKPALRKCFPFFDSAPLLARRRRKRARTCVHPSEGAPRGAIQEYAKPRRVARAWAGSLN